MEQLKCKYCGKLSKRSYCSILCRIKSLLNKNKEESIVEEINQLEEPASDIFNNTNEFTSLDIKQAEDRSLLPRTIEDPIILEIETAEEINDIMDRLQIKEEPILEIKQSAITKFVEAVVKYNNSKTDPILYCQHCNKELKGKQTKYCSSICKNKARDRRIKKEPSTLLLYCQHCNKELEGKQTKFCSLKCKGKARDRKKVKEVINPEVKEEVILKEEFKQVAYTTPNPSMKNKVPFIIVDKFGKAMTLYIDPAKTEEEKDRIREKYLNRNINFKF